MFTDLVGNDNEATNIFKWTSDRARPIMTITSTTVNSGNTTNDASINLIFSSNKQTNNFTEDDIVIDSLTNDWKLENFSPIQGGLKYNVSLRPVSVGSYKISVNENSFTDLVGNGNKATIFEWNYDIIKPTMTITSNTVNSGETSNATSIDLIFSSNKTTNFNSSNLTVFNGVLSNFNTDNQIIHSGTFTPNQDGLCSIQVASNQFEDDSGNSNEASNVF